jgi:hypothetical protein
MVKNKTSIHINRKDIIIMQFVANGFTALEISEKTGAKPVGNKFKYFIK